MNISALLADTTLSWEQLLADNQPLPFTTMRQLIQSASAPGKVPALGIALGTAMPVAAHGAVGYAVSASKNMQQALDALSRYARLRSDALEFRLTTFEDNSVLYIREISDLQDVRIPILETTMLMLARLFEAMTGHPLHELEYRFPYPAPPWQQEYPAALRGKIGFDANCLCIVIPRHWLGLPNLLADDGAYHSAVRDCEAELMLSRQQNTVVQQVRKRLNKLGTQIDSRWPTCAEMAAALHMSERSLIRKLKTHACNYQTLLDEARCEKAQWHLRHTQLTVEEIAARLGYLDTSNFSRSFKRWTGLTPSQFRLNAKELHAR